MPKLAPQPLLEPDPPAPSPVNDAAAKPGQFDARDWLAGMDGFSYLTDPSGVILATNEPVAEVNETKDDSSCIAPSTVVGRSIFSMLQGEEVRLTYRRLHDKVLSGDKPRLSFQFRCDAPEVERKMKLAIGAVRQAGTLVGVLYQSTLLSSQQRVPLNFLSNDEALRAYRQNANLPLVTICNFCADVVLPNTQPPLWIKPETYYYRHGPMDVRLSHGVCPTCRVMVLDPLLAG